MSEAVSPTDETVAERALAIGKSTYSVVLLLVLWEGVAQTGLVHPHFLPPLSEVVLTFWDLTVAGKMGYATYLTLRRALAGLAVAVLFGVPIGVLCGRSRIVGWFFDPIIAVGYPVPIIALIPVFILWFGIGDVSKVLLVALGAFWPIAVNARNSTESVDTELVWSARMMGTTRRAVLWRVVLPESAPGVLTGIQIALPISLIITFIFEMVAGGGGLGFLEIQGVRGFESAQTFAAILAIMIVGFGLDRLFRVLQARLLAWS